MCPFTLFLPFKGGAVTRSPGLPGSFTPPPLNKPGEVRFFTIRKKTKNYRMIKNKSGIQRKLMIISLF